MVKLVRNKGCVRGGNRGSLCRCVAVSLCRWVAGSLSCWLTQARAGGVSFANRLRAVTILSVACVVVGCGLLRRRLKARGAERTKLRGVAQ